MEQNWGPRRDVPWNTISYCQPVAVGRCVKELHDLKEHRISGRILNSLGLLGKIPPFIVELINGRSGN
jgi:hypothetical protein